MSDKPTVKTDVQTGKADDKAYRQAVWQEDLERIRKSLLDMLGKNKWKRGSAKAIAAEYAFTIGVEAALGKSIPYLAICRMSGRSILD